MTHAIGPRSKQREAGTSMIEVLVAIVIVVLGLLGLAGLQAHAALADMEAFQRAQGLVLLQDMVDRLNSNRKNVTAYQTAVPLGTDTGAQDCSGLTAAVLDMCEWSNALVGAGESSGGLKVGAMIGARGCIDVVKATKPREILISVAWQGTTPTKAPVAALTCGFNSYGSETFRRLITAKVVIGCLQNDPASNLCL